MTVTQPGETASCSLLLKPDLIAWHLSTRFGEPALVFLEKELPQQSASPCRSPTTPKTFQFGSGMHLAAIKGKLE